MKKLIIIAILIISFGFTTGASAVSLGWSANTDSATGYILYYQQAGATDIYSEAIQGRETVTYTVDNSKFQPGEDYSFWLTAYNTAAESGPSNVVPWTAPMFVPSDNPAPVIIQIPGKPASVTINIGDN